MEHSDTEKEASEVLHTLLSVERIEKSDPLADSDHSTSSFPSSCKIESDNTESEAQIQWHSTPVSISQSLFSSIDNNSHFQQSMDDQQVVIWEDHTIVDGDNQTIENMYTGHVMDEGNDEEDEEVEEEEEEEVKEITIEKESDPREEIMKSCNNLNDKGVENKEEEKQATKKIKKKNGLPQSSNHNDPTKLEESAAQVKERFKRGCECQDESCFRGLNPESVYKHRLNIAELTKAEHDMYLMGVTMACIANPDTTVRNKERRRLRAQYVYQGRRVCLDAFLYLENCTHYQLKRIRKHVMTHGVAPRVHGNHGKKPHNTFSLDIYRHATEFLKQYLEQHSGLKDILNTKQAIQLPWDVTRKNLHEAYREYGQIIDPGIKLMGYSTFRHFMKEQFPHVKFCKIEPKNQTSSNQNNQQQTPAATKTVTERKCVINANEVQQVIPLVVAQNDGITTQHQQTFLVTPVPQLLSNSNIVTQQTNNHAATNTYSYQLTNAGYVISEQANIVTTMAQNAQNQTPYTFSRI